MRTCSTVTDLRGGMGEEWEMTLLFPVYVVMSTFDACRAMPAPAQDVSTAAHIGFSTCPSTPTYLLYSYENLLHGHGIERKNT